MKGRQGSPPPRQSELQSPSGNQTRSPGASRFSHIEHSLPTTPTHAATTVTSTTFVPTTPSVAGQKRPAEDYDEDFKRSKNKTVVAPPETFSFPTLPSTTFHLTSSPTPRPVLPPTSFHPGASTPATSAMSPAEVSTRSSSVKSAVEHGRPTPTASRQMAPMTTGSAVTTRASPALLKATKLSTSRNEPIWLGTTSRGEKGKGKERGGDGGRKEGFKSDMDVMNYVDDDLMGGASNLSMTGFRRSSSDFESEHAFETSTTAQGFVHGDLLSAIVTRIAGTDHKLTVDPEVIEYLALATKQRLRVMTERMICASQHRRKSLETHSPPLMYDNDHPMFRIQTSQNVKKQLLAIERAEREEELKRKQHVEELRVESLTASKAQVRGILRDVGESGKRGKKAVQFQFRPNPKRKAKEPKVVLTEMQGLKFANQAALAFAEHRGRESTYAWMTAGGGILKRPLKLASAETTADGAVDLLSPSSSPGSGGSFQPLGRSVAGLCDTNIPLVSVKDALFCLENEHGGKGAGLKVLVKHYIK